MESPETAPTPLLQATLEALTKERIRLIAVYGTTREVRALDAHIARLQKVLDSRRPKGPSSFLAIKGVDNPPPRCPWWLDYSPRLTAYSKGRKISDTELAEIKREQGD